jgi:hypothetical protein
MDLQAPELNLLSLGTKFENELMRPGMVDRAFLAGKV